MGDGITPEERYPDFVAIAKGFSWERGTSLKKPNCGRRCWK